MAYGLFGVATPSDLISDRTRTPFNIGTAIELTGFTITEAKPLVAGLQERLLNPEIILEAIINWTGGQPFLTQKLCNLVLKSYQVNETSFLPGTEIDWIKNLVNTKIINNWEAQDEPEHLQTIRDRLLSNEAKASRLLRLAEQIFRYGFVSVDDSPEQKDLLLSNLVLKKNGQLIIRNPIYQKIFNLDWIEHQQDQLRPYGRELEFWLASQGQDKSRLLRGQKRDILASGSEDKTIRLSNSNDGRLLKVLVGHQSKILAINFSPDGNLNA
ncbi:MAG: WD40 repeat domain-containing protein [Waterburya sp.]